MQWGLRVSKDRARFKRLVRREFTKRNVDCCVSSQQKRGSDFLIWSRNQVRETPRFKVRKIYQRSSGLCVDDLCEVINHPSDEAN